MTDKQEKIEQAATGLGQKAIAWLRGKGWSETLAKVTVGAVLGAALGIAAAFGLTGCSGSFTQSASGDVTANWAIVPISVQK